MSKSCCSLAVVLAASLPGLARAAEPTVLSGLSAADLFDLADQARANGRESDADAIYRALTQDPNIEIRTEARFRLGRLLLAQRRATDAAILFRAILDEKPDAQRVRLELARALAMTGDVGAAMKMLRQAAAGGLPPEIATVVKQFTQAYRAQRPFGASLELALAPDSNINRATDADTLDTVIAPLQLSRDARRTSGVGFTVGSQVFARLPVLGRVNWLTRLSGRGQLYRQHEFNDVTLGWQTGAEWVTGRSVISPSIGQSYRWYGGDHYADTDSAALEWRRSLGTRAQLTLSGSAGRTRYERNRLQDGGLYAGAIGIDRALSQRSGISISLSGQRQDARDPGYATWSGGVTLSFYREIGKVTAYVSGSVRRLEADERLFLYPRRRQETYWSIGAGGTFRQVKVAGFSPLIRVTHEDNRSTVGIYDYRRNAVDFGITRPF
jgi:tetratricopeptide (TPR) repeat protein